MLAVLPEEVHIRVEPVPEEGGIDTDVDLAGRFPGDVRVAGGQFLDGLQPGAAGTEVRTAVLRVHGRGARIELPGAGQIQEAGAVGVVVTDQTPGAAEFQIAHEIPDGLPPGLAGRDPAQGDGREGAVAFAGSEVLGTVAADVEVQQVLGRIVVGDTADQADITSRNGLVDVAAVVTGIVGLALVVEEQRADVVLAETAVVVEARFRIPVAAAPLGLAVGRRPGDVLLAEDLLAVDDGGDIGQTRTVTVLPVLAGGVLGVVGHLGLEIQTLGDETQVQFVLDVEVQHIRAFVLVTEVVVVRERVAVILADEVRVRNDVTAFLVDAAAGIGRRTLQVTEEEPFTAAHRVAVLHASAQGDGHLAEAGDVDVEVRAIVKTLIVKGLVLVVGERLEQGILVQETGGDEIAHPFGTAVHVHVGLFLPGGIVHDIVYPVHVRERAGHVAGAEMLHDFLAEPDAGVGIRRIIGDFHGTGPGVHRKRVGDGGVVPHLAVGIGIGEVDELGDRLHGGVGRGGHRGLSGRTALGGHEDDTVRAADTEHGRSRCVLEDGDALDFVGIQLGERTFDAVHEDQRFRAVQGSDAADADDRFVSTRHGGRLDGGHTGEISLEGVRHVRDRGLHQAFAAHRGNRTGNGHLLLLAIRDDHGLVQRGSVGQQGDGEGRTCHLDRLCRVSDTRNLERGATGNGQREITVQVGDRSVRGPLYDHAGADHPLSLFVQDLASHALVLGGNLSGQQEQEHQHSEQMR